MSWSLAEVSLFARLQVFLILAATLSGALYSLAVDDMRLMVRCLVLGAFMTVALIWSQTARREGWTLRAKRLWMAVLVLLFLLIVTMVLYSPLVSRETIP